jgi:hypothetical protein
MLRYQLCALWEMARRPRRMTMATPRLAIEAMPALAIEVTLQ